MSPSKNRSPAKARQKVSRSSPRRKSGSGGQPKVAPASKDGEKQPRPLYTDGDVRRRIKIPGEGPDGPEWYRSPWRRDFARVIHCPSFRRQQGKTQLFPGAETDFFRNRLTHSLEVAQIAKSIAIKINNTEPFFKRPKFQIDTDLVETVALVHDIGHPPFGHTGEQALDECMKNKGGFEGNAQTLRILARLEKRQRFSNSSPTTGISPEGVDRRVGLNLCYRTLGSVLKYDKEIHYDRRTSDKLAKGYYRSEAAIVRNIKKYVTGADAFLGEFKTIECQIMDIADDIAYSTYDLEDSFKARFLTPLSMFGANEALINEVASRVSERLDEPYGRQQLIKCLFRVFKDLFEFDDEASKIDLNEEEGIALLIAHYSSLADKMTNSGYLRTAFTSELVGKFIDGIEVIHNDEIPALSVVRLRRPVLETVEVLKHFTFSSLIMSPRLKVTAFRGLEIVKALFKALTNRDGEGERLLPDDVLSVFSEIRDEDRDRVICDFIAGMTDRYAIEFYGRLTSERPETIFKPH
jgi:dGTPase